MGVFFANSSMHQHTFSSIYFKQLVQILMGPDHTIKRFTQSNSLADGDKAVRESVLYPYFFLWYTSQKTLCLYCIARYCDKDLYWRDPTIFFSNISMSRYVFHHSESTSHESAILLQNTLKGPYYYFSMWSTLRKVWELLQ